MAQALQGRIAAVEKAVAAEQVMESVQALADLEPAFGRPGRKLGL